MNNLLDFYKINKEYLKYLSDNIDSFKFNNNSQIYVGPVFFKNSACNYNLEFYAPITVPAKEDFVYDIDIINSLSDEELISHRIEPISRVSTLPLSDENWIKNNDYNMVAVIQMSDMIPVPKNEIQWFDFRNNLSELNINNKKDFYSRLKFTEQIFEDMATCICIRDLCINYYADKISYEAGRYEPENFYSSSLAKEKINELTLGGEGAELETLCILFESSEYQKKKDKMFEKGSVLGKLAQKKLFVSKDTIKKEVESLVSAEQRRPRVEKKQPNFYIST